MAYTTIKKPSDYFNTKLYTGNGSTQSITGVGFQPDFTWIKSRSSGSWHHVGDVLRGADKRLQTNSTNAESTATTGITSWDSDGFSLGSNGDTNSNTNNFASWNWLADNTSGSSNTDGSITSTVSANTTAGFSIVSYTGTGSASTIGHGLGAVPRMIIVKNRDDADSWVVQHGSLGAGKALNLDSTGAVQTYDPYWNGTEPTTSVFSIGTDGRTNGSSEDFIGYCFAEKKGFSKFGSYVGNNNADGNFVYLGFKPAFVIAKNTTTAGYSWELFDNKRNTTDGVGNVIQKRLFPDSSAAEGGTSSTDYIDFLSNGFKIRKAGDTNASGDTYIYMAFAEEPLVGDNPATAR